MTPIERDDDATGEGPHQHIWRRDQGDLVDLGDQEDAIGTTTVRKPLWNPTFHPIAEIPVAGFRWRLFGF
jgi:hypothetical protein